MLCSFADRRKGDGESSTGGNCHPFHSLAPLGFKQLKYDFTVTLVVLTGGGRVNDSNVISDRICERTLSVVLCAFMPSISVVCLFVCCRPLIQPCGWELIAIERALGLTTR